MVSKSTVFQCFSLKTSLIDNEFRLYASSYSLGYAESRRFIEEISKKVDVVKIEDLTKSIFHRPRFKRLYTNKKNGLPFLMPTDVFMFPLKPRKFIINPPKGLSVEKGWILLTCSGTVGRTIIATKQLSECILSHDIIRIIPERRLTGYIYTYLNTWIGQAFLTKDQYGATVKHIEPEHVASIPIPRIPEIEKEIHEKIMKAHKMIEKAQELLLEAERMIYTELGLPEIDEDEIEYFGDEDGRIAKAFTVSSRELNYRLDSSYHSPIVREAKKAIANSSHQKRKLKEICKTIFVPNRFKRPYVEKQYGVAFLQGSHIPLIKPFDVKYIWRGLKNIEKLIIKRDWILLTRSGTVGKVALVRDYFDGWTASEHIIRIIPKVNETNQGFLTSFLMSQFGEIQLSGIIYGGVVDEIAEKDTSLIENVFILNPPRDIQDEIGNRVIQAYDLRDSAIRIEEEAVKLLEQKISELVRNTLN